MRFPVGEELAGKSHRWQKRLAAAVASEAAAAAVASEAAAAEGSKRRIKRLEGNTITEKKN